MAQKTKVTKKTTRNAEFNSYITGDESGIMLNSVTSRTATEDNPNIRLLDVNEAIVKKGAQITDDAFQNTVIIELFTNCDTATAKKLRDYALSGEPEDPKELAEYKKLSALLEKKGVTFEKIKSMIINYQNNDWLNEAANIKLDVNSKYYIFGAPEQVVLNNRQHHNNCGIESTLNNLAMAGIVKMKKDLSDQLSTENRFLKKVWNRNLAGDNGEVGVLDVADGGTMPDDYRDILEYYGIDSKSYFITTKSDDTVYPKEKINELAYKISQGYGAVLGVCSQELWNNVKSETGVKQIDHAIAITGVVYDTNNITPVYNDLTNEYEYASPVGFYIHDTGAWMTRFISYDDFIKATLCNYVGVEGEENYLSTLKEYDSRLERDIIKDREGIFITLTDEPIKTETFKLNATGDKQNNILWGNNSDNVLKGKGGNDILYGRAGRDKIYGGSGNDVIVGNNAFKVALDTPEISFEYNSVDDFKGYLEKLNLLNERTEAKLNKITVDDYGTKTTIEAFENTYNSIPKGINDIYGGSGNDIIIGGEYADLIYGGKGDDYIWGGSGRNAVYGGEGNDVIIGGYDNDRLFGDAGNDYIFGLEDDDVINGGAGNDHIWGGAGSDTIEVGKGKDTVYFEGTGYGQDTISAKSGTTTFKFVDDEDYGVAASKASDMFYSLEKDEENKNQYTLQIQYTLDEAKDDDAKIEFSKFFNKKTGTTKSLNINAADATYKVIASTKSKVSVANTGKNNILLTLNDKGVSVTTSAKNDIVTITSNSDTVIGTAIDKINYVGGVDKFVSEDRDTYYTAGEIDENTNLSIYDNVIGLTKAEFDKEGWEANDDPTLTVEDFFYEYDNYASTGDRLYLESEKSDINYLFDVAVSGDDAITTENSGLYLLSGENYVDIVKGTATGGFIYMDSFLKFDKTADTLITGEDFYGNGQIEGIYYKDSQTADSYTADLTGIASSVATWLNTYNQAHAGSEFESAFDAFKNGDEDVVAALVAAYQNV